MVANLGALVHGPTASMAIPNVVLLRRVPDAAQEGAVAASRDPGVLLDGQVWLDLLGGHRTAESPPGKALQGEGKVCLG